MFFCCCIESFGGFFVVGVEQHHAETDDGFVPCKSAKIAERAELGDKCANVVVLIAFGRICCLGRSCGK